MKRKSLLKSIIMIAAISFSMNAIANPVDVERARNIGKKFLTNSVKVFQHKSDLRCTLEYTLKDDNGNPVLYVFNADYKGFVIVSAEDVVSPILGYSYEGNFNADNINPNAAYLLDDYKWTINHVRAQKIDATDEVKAQWEMVESIGRITAKKDMNTVEPLCTTTWNQNAYYNDLCPEDPDGPNGRVYAGCVATAMGQVMKFWNYPATGNGSHSYTPSGYPQQTANFGETFYDFTIMPDYIDSTSTEEEIFAVAQLLWHCGIAVDMMYSPDGSGAYSSDVPDVVINHFLYQSSTIYEDRWFSNNWDQQLRDNLDGGMPIYYSGQDSNGGGGHAFVCDGYDDNNMFHFNLGWSGSDNGWYPSNAINTEHGPYYFNSGQGAIFNMAPDEAYFNKPAAPTNLVVTPAPNFQLSTTITWNNPTFTMNATPLTTMNIVIERDNEVIATFENVNAGEEGTFTDDQIEGFGGYEYKVYAISNDQEGAPASSFVIIGPNCPITIEMHDSYGDGWNGANIEIQNSVGGTIGTATIGYGNSSTETFELPEGVINFSWHKGSWDSECSFQIINSDGDVIYSRNTELPNGQFFTYDNQCASVIPIAGDANEDGAVNITDISTLIAAMMELNPQPYNPINADCNGDGLVNVLDVIVIVNIIMSQE